MSSTELFRKHFGNQSASVDLKHPNMEKFFNELNEECLLEDKQKQCNHSWVYKILHDHTAKNVCENADLNNLSSREGTILLYLVIYLATIIIALIDLIQKLIDFIFPFEMSFSCRSVVLADNVEYKPSF